MGAIETIMIGMASAGAILTYMGFKLSESDSESMRVVGSMLFLTAFTFVIGIVWVASQVAENESIAYLSSGLVPYLVALTYIFIAIAILMFFRILWVGLHILIDWLSLMSGVRERRYKE